MTFYGSPSYSVKYYREGLYKLIKFHFLRGVCLHDREEEKPLNNEKLDAALSRARSVFYQLAMCNDWDFFFSGTLSSDLRDRYDLFSFRNDFAQFVRDLRKRPGYENLAYVLIPERHKDGAWHMHGLISGLPESALSYFVPGVHPQKLVDGGYRNWGDYGARFGYCSLGHIRDSEAVAAYLTKYLTKDMASSVQDVGGHTYYCTRGLKRSVSFGSVYGDVPALDVHLDYNGPYCSTGMVRGVSWSYWLDYIDCSNLQMICTDDDFVEFIPDPMAEQLVIAGFPMRRGGVVANIPVSCSGAAGSIPAPAPIIGEG